jgi:hypothetical protein
MFLPFLIGSHGLFDRRRRETHAAVKIAMTTTKRYSTGAEI